MKSTLVFILCTLAIANCEYSLKEIDSDKFGHTILDTIMLQLRNMDIEDGDLTGPPKVIYDMLIELRDSLAAEQIGDTEGLTRMCVECTNTNTEFSDKIYYTTEQMKNDADELTSLENGMNNLQTEVTNTNAEVTRVQGILDSLETAHTDALNGFDSLIAEARETRGSLSEAKVIIENNLVSDGSSAVLLQTSAGVSTMNKLAQIDNRYKGHAMLALEFMELASHDDIVSDQGMVGELLAAFDELIADIDGQITSLNGQRSAAVDDYNATKSPYETEMRLARTTQNAAQTALRTAGQRVDHLKEKVGTDTEDLAAWKQFVDDETVRCQSEEIAYHSRLDDRDHQLGVLDQVIELFETRFVELNEYINSQVRMEGDDIVQVGVVV